MSSVSNKHSTGNFSITVHLFCIASATVVLGVSSNMIRSASGRLVVDVYELIAAGYGHSILLSREDSSPDCECEIHEIRCSKSCQLD